MDADGTLESLFFISVLSSFFAAFSAADEAIADPRSPEIPVPLIG